MRNQNGNNYIQPDLKPFTFAVSDYFTRDKNEKNAAAIAMALSQLDQDDVFQFTQRILIESEKYDDKEIKKLSQEISELYYGDLDGKLPDTSLGDIPLIFLRADAVTEAGKVRIKGIINEGVVHEVLPWSYWQSLKLISSKKIMQLASKLIKKMDDINNVSSEMVTKLDEIEVSANELSDAFDCDVVELISYDYIKDDEDRNFTHDKQDFMTFNKESPDPDARKFKIYSRDYFYNLQILISQVFNSNNFSESMYHLCRVATFIESKMFTRSKEKMFVVGPKDPSIFQKFVTVVYDSFFLNSLSSNHQYFTQDERLKLNYVENSVRSSLTYCGTKIMSLVNFILTIIPYQKQNRDWSEGEMQ